MFPNPQDALPLPPRPSVEHYKKLAKALVKAFRSGDVGEWADEWVRSLLKATGETFRRHRIDRWINDVEEFAQRKMGETCTLAAAQYVIARSQGFLSWPKFAKFLNAAASRFEEAAEAIVTGDVDALKKLLREDPGLVRARSVREHGATLLHYTSANGVEGYRQKSPQNIVGIAKILLDAGAEIDATADVYGGGCTTLGLAATSVHPERAGVQEALLQLLLDRGASMGMNAGNGHTLIKACLANGRPKAAKFLAERGAPLDLPGAAATGRLDEVKRMFEGATQRQRDEALGYAALYGALDVAEFLLAKGGDLASHLGDGQTPTHMAVIGGQLEMLKLLLRHDPPLEMINAYGGSVLGQTMWSAAHGGESENFIRILEALVEAGARVPEGHVPVNEKVDAWLEQHGSRAEPAWYWFGEKPRR